MQFVVTEKNSVARSIAAVGGAHQKQKGYLEGNGYWVSWCVGHLVVLAAPFMYDEKYAKWRVEDLPILPKDWRYTVIESTKAQFNVLRTLMNDARVTSIVCATDAGREGELIFRLVYSLCGCTKPVERLWISSLEDAAIAEGFRNLRPSKEYDKLYHAALCRAQADWLVGINATRLFSTRYHQLLNIGRVMTPTLALLVEREAQIQAFQSTPFYTVQLDCGLLSAISERLTERAKAERITALCESSFIHWKYVGSLQRCSGNRQWQGDGPSCLDSYRRDSRIRSSVSARRRTQPSDHAHGAPALRRRNTLLDSRNRRHTGV